MVALLHPDAQPPASGRRPGLRLVVDNTVEKPAAGALADRGDQRGGAPSGAGLFPAVDPSVASVILAVAVVVFGSLFLLRAVQGSPEATPGVGLSAVEGAAATPVVAGPGDTVIVAKPGDSMWSIAVLLTPDSDPRPAVNALIEANGTDSVRIGQQIVIPEQLLD